MGYSRGIWEKARDGSDCGFGWFGSGFLRRAVIGGIYCGWNLLTVCMLSQLRFRRVWEGIRKGYRCGSLREVGICRRDLGNGAEWKRLGVRCVWGWNKKEGGNWRNLFSGGWGNRGGVDAVTI